MTQTFVPLQNFPQSLLSLDDFGEATASFACMELGA